MENSKYLNQINQMHISLLIFYFIFKLTDEEKESYRESIHTYLRPDQDTGSKLTVSLCT